jgi:probable HAF family extracellular repeat protein
MNRIAWRGLVVSALLVLGSCGGGGGSGDAVGLNGSGIDATAATGGSPGGSPSSGSPSSGSGPVAHDGVPSAKLATWTVVFQQADAEAGRQGLSRNGLLAFTAITEEGRRARMFDGETVHELVDPKAASAIAVNDSGQVAGNFENPGNRELFRWQALTETTTNDLIGTPPDISTTGQAINANGVITGNISDRRNFPGAAIRWAPGTLRQVLAELDPSPLINSNGLFINTAGAVAGVSDVPDRQVHAAFWRAGGADVLDIGTFGGANSAPTDLNDAGQVVGQADDADGNPRAFLWTESEGPRDLGTLGGRTATANALNASGWVVGTADTAEGGTEAFLWRDGAMRSLGTLGGRSSAASAINAAGLVGGNSDTSNGVPHAFVWSEDMGLVDLNDRLSGAAPGVLQTVLAVADNGTVLAVAEGGTLVLLRLSDDDRAPKKKHDGHHDHR